MPQEMNPKYAMTKLDLEHMDEYIYYNDLLFDLDKESIDSIKSACDRVITRDLMNDPNVRNRVESSYIEQISEIVDEIRSNYSVSKEIIASIVYILHKYYGTLFSQIKMKDSIDGSISSYDLCLNYYNCKIARDNLDEWIKVQETRREQNKR